MTFTAPRKRPAFTLIELLVVVAIGFYALSAVGAALGWISTTKEEPVPAQTA